MAIRFSQILFELSCMDVVVYRDRIVVVTNKIEAPRLKEEEFSGEEELIIVNWFEGREGQLPKGERIGVDGAESDRVNLQTEIETLRRSLNDKDGRDGAPKTAKSLLPFAASVEIVQWLKLS